jgi:hypothetical protein
MRSFLPPYVLPFSSSVYVNFPATWRCASDWHKNHSCSYRRTKWCRLSGGHEARTLVGFTTRVACRVLCPLFSIFHLQQVSSVDPTLERLVVEPKVMGAFLSHFNDASRLHAPSPPFYSSARFPPRAVIRARAIVSPGILLYLRSLSPTTRCNRTLLRKVHRRWSHSSSESPSPSPLSRATFVLSSHT